MLEYKTSPSPRISSPRNRRFTCLSIPAPVVSAVISLSFLHVSFHSFLSSLSFSASVKTSVTLRHRYGISESFVALVFFMWNWNIRLTFPHWDNRIRVLTGSGGRQGNAGRSPKFSRWRLLSLFVRESLSLSLCESVFVCPVCCHKGRPLFDFDVFRSDLLIPTTCPSILYLAATPVKEIVPYLSLYVHIRSRAFAVPPAPLQDQPHLYGALRSHSVSVPA